MIYLLPSMKQAMTPSLRGRPREFDLEKALDRAMKVFWGKGYLGASLSDLTAAMRINRPSLYAAFGNKESLFQKVLERYNEGPSAWFREALEEPTARRVVERMLRGAVEMATNSRYPRGCLWVRGTFSCGDPAQSIREQLLVHRTTGEAELRKRFERAIREGDLPATTDALALARYVLTMN